MAYEAVLTLEELPSGKQMVVEIRDTWVAIFNVNGQLYAIEDICTHDYGPLGDGEVNGLEVECPRHGARFNLETGKPTFPAVKPVNRYAVKTEGQDILVDLEEVLNKV
jgi:3-phenylpropionate/trans-cinnamate dioxygenase ferredoxin component